jgi:hypothetical protein
LAKEECVKYIGEWTSVDKSAWGPGPWQDEPDKVHWIDAESNLDCLMVRHPSLGHWCGYVGVTEGHPAFEKGYDDVDVRVHGGLTFANACQESEDPATGVCHVAQPGRPDHVFWLGFDCAHGGDVSPGMQSRFRELAKTNPIFNESEWDRFDVYRDRAYVEAEVIGLARQLAQ